MTDRDQDPIRVLMAKWCDLVKWGVDAPVAPKKLIPRRAFNPKMRPMMNVPLSITVGEFRPAGNNGSCDVNFEVLFNG